MIEKKLCDACLKLLSGDRDQNLSLSDDATHHTDAESFRRALQLPCYLCCFAWVKSWEIEPCDDDIPDGTHYSFVHRYESGENIAGSLWFPLHPEGSYPIRLEPWESS